MSEMKKARWAIRVAFVWKGVQLAKLQQCYNIKMGILKEGYAITESFHTDSRTLFSTDKKTIQFLFQSGDSAQMFAVVNCIIVVCKRQACSLFDLYESI